MTGRTRPELAAALLIAITVTGCAIEEVTPAPRCDRRDGSIVIVAQSVPDASRVPCIDDRGAGWRAVQVHVGDDGTQLRFTLGPDRSVHASVSFTGACPASGDDSRRIDGEGIEVSALGRFGRRFRFRGGCVTVELADGVGAEAAAALVESVVLVDRSGLAGGREL